MILSLPIRQKLAIVIGIAALSSSALGLFALQQLHMEMIRGRIDGLRAVVQTLRATSDDLARQISEGRISRDQAVARLRDAALVMTFGPAGANYVALYDMNGVAIQHPNAAIVGTSRLDTLTGGVAVVRLERDDILAHGDSVRFYPFPRPGAATPLPKVGYAAGDGHFGLIVSTSAYLDDIEAAFRPLALRVIGVLVGGIATMTALAWLMARSISRPLAALRGAMVRIADGDLAAPLGRLTGRDEVADMARAVDVFKRGMIEGGRLRDEQEALKAQAAAEQRAIRNRMAEQFEAKVGLSVRLLAEGAARLEATAGSLTLNAGQASSQAAAVAASAREASQSVQAVAAAAEQLTASIGETGRATGNIAAQVSRIQHATGEAVSAIAGIAGVIDRISESAISISAAVEQQSAATAEIARNVQHTALATRDVTATIAGVSTAAEGTGEAATQAHDVASDVSQQADTLSTEVGRFITEVRAA